jgi:hypothetical protein
METTHDPDQLLTLRTCAALTERKESTWRKDVLLKKVPVVRIGRQVRIKRRDLEAMIARSYRPAISA